MLIKNEIREAHILAHDIGDTIAQELLARQLEKSNQVDWLSCLFLNGGIFPETHRALFIQKLLISPFGPVAANFFSEKSFKKNMRRIFSNDHPPSDEFIRETWKLIKENGGVAMIPRLIQYMQERKQHRRRWVTPLEENIIPLRLINGLADPISGSHAANRYEELVPNADIVRIANSGHYPHIETPYEVVNALFDFHSNN